MKASLIYRRTKNLRAVPLLLGHSRLESTVRYLGADIDDALELAEQTELGRPAGGPATRPYTAGTGRLIRGLGPLEGERWPPTWPKPHGPRAGTGGRDRDRTCDPFHVKEVLYR
jgi:hypothetical protein